MMLVEEVQLLALDVVNKLFAEEIHGGENEDVYVRDIDFGGNELSAW